MVTSRKTRTSPRTWTAGDKFPFGQFKDKPIGWLADHFPHQLESWQRSRNIVFSDEISARIKNAKFLAQ
jgi:hypothetical protein